MGNRTHGALLTIADLIETAGLRPALVIGVPVGFVNVVESKERLFEVCTAHGVPAIVAMGRKGGSNVAAAICNALGIPLPGCWTPPTGDGNILLLCLRSKCSAAHFERFFSQFSPRGVFFHWLAWYTRLSSNKSEFIYKGEY